MMANTCTSYKTIWFTTAGTDCEPPKPKPLPFFLDPEQIRQLTPEIDWDKRVGARIEHFRKWAMEPVRLAA